MAIQFLAGLQHGFRLRNRSQPGLAPGTVSVDPESPKPVIHVIAYGPQEVVEKTLASPDEILEYLNRWPTVWVNVDGLGDAAVLRRIGEIFDLHRLTVEDIVNVHQRPKVERYDNQLFIVTRDLHQEPSLWTEQISMVLGTGALVTFQEEAGDCFEAVRHRLRSGHGRIRGGGAGYLTYALLDAIIDTYFPLIEQYGDRLDELEARILKGADQATLSEIHALKKDLLRLRRTIWPQREAINSLMRDEGPFFDAESKLHLRDGYDHCVQIIDMLENLREFSASLVDLHMSSISNRLNEVMKVLTIISTLFIPLSFITGIFGMNFHSEASPLNMPELSWYYGYPAALALMFVVALIQVYFFWRKGWLRRSEKRRKKRAGHAQSSPGHKATNGHRNP